MLLKPLKNSWNYNKLLQKTFYVTRQRKSRIKRSRCDILRARAQKWAKLIIRFKGQTPGTILEGTNNAKYFDALVTHAGRRKIHLCPFNQGGCKAFAKRRAEICSTLLSQRTWLYALADIHIHTYARDEQWVCIEVGNPFSSGRRVYSMCRLMGYKWAAACERSVKEEEEQKKVACAIRGRIAPHNRAPLWQG